MFSLDIASGNPKYPDNSQNHDICFDEDGNLRTVTNGEAVAQRVRQHLEFYQGEWFLNTEVGVPWLQYIFVEPFDQSTAESLIKIAILEVPGVEEILEFVVDFDTINRGFAIKRVVITTEYNEKVTI